MLIRADNIGLSLNSIKGLFTLGAGIKEPSFEQFCANLLLEFHHFFLRFSLNELNFLEHLNDVQ